MTSDFGVQLPEVPLLASIQRHSTTEPFGMVIDVHAACVFTSLHALGGIVQVVLPVLHVPGLLFPPFCFCQQHLSPSSYPAHCVWLSRSEHVTADWTMHEPELPLLDSTHRHSDAEPFGRITDVQSSQSATSPHELGGVVHVELPVLHNPRLPVE